MARTVLVLLFVVLCILARVSVSISTTIITKVQPVSTSVSMVSWVSTNPSAYNRLEYCTEEDSVHNIFGTDVCIENTEDKIRVCPMDQGSNSCSAWTLFSDCFSSDRIDVYDRQNGNTICIEEFRCPHPIEAVAPYVHVIMNSTEIGYLQYLNDDTSMQCDKVTSLPPNFIEGKLEVIVYCVLPRTEIILLKHAEVYVGIECLPTNNSDSTIQYTVRNGTCQSTNLTLQNTGCSNMIDRLTTRRPITTDCPATCPTNNVTTNTEIKDTTTNTEVKDMTTNSGVRTIYKFSIVMTCMHILIAYY